MKDRIPATGKGGRVSLDVESVTVNNGVLSLTDTDGSIYGILAHADSPVQEGSKYNKANVLPTTVTAKLGITDSTAEPKDAFIAIANKITSANNNITTIQNTVSGNFTQVATYNANTDPDKVPDWRSVDTSKTDFLITVSAVSTRSSNDLNISIGSVVFGKTVTQRDITLKPRIYRSGNVWLCNWDDGILEWKWVVSGESSYTVKAYLGSQSMSNTCYVNSMTIYGR